MILALGWLLLHGRPGAGHKTTDSHCSSCHHVVTLVRFSFQTVDRFGAYFLDYLSRSFRIKRGLGFFKDLGLSGDLWLKPFVSLFSSSFRYMFRGRKFACLTSMYERRGLSTSRAWPNACQVEYTGSTPRIRWDAQSCLSQCIKFFGLSTKFRSRTCTTLRSFLNLLVSARK